MNGINEIFEKATRSDQRHLRVARGVSGGAAALHGHRRCVGLCRPRAVL